MKKCKTESNMLKTVDTKIPTNKLYNYNSDSLYYLFKNFGNTFQFVGK